jgi:biopolymer transport protein ExbD
MAGFSSSKPQQPITGINVTPLVDITLVLLIIFMVTAKLVVSQAIPMDLPRAATGGEVQVVYAVSVAADGALTVDGRPVANDAELLRTARFAQQNNAELRAVLRADGAVPHARVLHAMDVLRQAGIARIAFAVAPGPNVELDSGQAKATPAPEPAK